jgi:hypothetical protein
MLQIEPLNRLLEEKWDKFAARMFFLNFMVYLVYLSVFTAVAYYRKKGTVRSLHYHNKLHYSSLAGPRAIKFGSMQISFRYRGDQMIIYELFVTYRCSEMWCFTGSATVLWCPWSKLGLNALLKDTSTDLSP